MKRTLSPRELAEAIGASESSLKRWADDGELRFERTRGGHRRIPLSEAVRFIRERRAALVRPDALGLPDLATVASLEQPSLNSGAAADEQLLDATQQLHEHLVAGRASQARGLVLFLYMTGHDLASLCDGPIRESLRRIGDLWQHGPEGIFVEHVATGICIDAIEMIRMLLPAPATAWAAVGGAPEKDPYLLPSLAAASVLAAEGIHAVNLGPNTPADALLHAIDHHGARLAWLSISAATDKHLLERDLETLAGELAKRGRILLMGGRACGAVRLPRSPFVQHCHSMAELAAFGRGMIATAEERS